MHISMFYLGIVLVVAALFAALAKSVSGFY
jgi:hypothetical protein